MTRAAIALAFAALTLTAACGGDTTDPPASQDTSTAQEGTATPAEFPTAVPDGEYTVLSESDLEAALLTIQDMPVGYSQEPPSEPGTKTFCDYEPPFNEQAHVFREFVKGGGISTEFLVVRLRQYESADQVRAAFDALTQALSTCQTETYEGTALEYAPLSAPKVGEESVGVRITADGTPLLQNFALVGPTIVATGGGGPMQTNADEIARLLELQVETYEAAAAQ